MAAYKGFTEAQAKAHKKYMETVATIQIRTTADRRELIKAHAEAVIERFWVEGAFASLAERQEMARIIHQGWNNPQAARWFDGQWQLIRENNIIVYQGNGKVRPVRPDRVITNGQETIVIDFKSGKRRRQHQDQVKQYMQLLSHMGYPDVKGYLWYVSEKGAPIVGVK